MLKYSVPQLSPSVVLDCELCVTFIREMFILWCWCAWQNKRAFISVEVCVLCVYSSRIGLFSGWESTFRWDGGCLCVGSRAKCVCLGGDMWTDGLWWLSAGVWTSFGARTQIQHTAMSQHPIIRLDLSPLRSNKLKSLMHPSSSNTLIICHINKNNYFWIFVIYNLLLLFIIIIIIIILNLINI